MKHLNALADQAEFFSSDSRKAQNNCVFVALKGENFDGHDFVLKLLEEFPQLKAVVSDAFAQKNSQHPHFSRMCAVANTHEAHRELARLFREKSRARVIAVGGSAGKTSTKEFLRQILEPHFEMVVTEKSQNGELGIPKTLEGLRRSTQLALIEVGIDRPADMERHMKIVQPDIGVLTSIGEEHLEQLRDLETVFEEESKLFEATWMRGGACFAPRGDKYLVRHAAHPHTYLSPDLPSDINPSWLTSLEHPLALRNAALAAQVAQFLGLDPSKIAAALKTLELPEGRGRSWINARGQKVIADHYNSNPASLRAGLMYMKSRALKEPLYLILGDMLELGPKSPDLHRELLLEALALQPKGLCLVGPQFAMALKNLSHASSLEVISVSNSEEARSKIQAWTNEAGQFFFKGSRGMRLEKALEIFI
jgi:UDP-N-acetylmuramoyl-tripeptide--D-alanyl-D-alanine ligase